MPSAVTTPPLHVLRGILRYIKSAPKQTFPRESSTLSSSSSKPIAVHPLHKHVIAQYKASQNLPSNDNQAKTLRKMAYDVFILKQDLKERGRLHEIDGGAEIKLTPKELSRRAAAKAGLQLPEETNFD